MSIPSSTFQKETSPNHMCLLSVNAMALLLTYFEIRILPEKQFDKNDNAGCALSYIRRGVKG